MKTVLGVLAGIVVAGLCVFAIEFIGHSVFPPPADTDLSNPAHVERLMATLPVGAFVFVLVGWFVGALAGAWVAIRIAQQSLAGWIVAAFVICAGGYTMMIIPHPVWMWVAGIALPIVGAWLAQRLAGSGTAASMS